MGLLKKENWLVCLILTILTGGKFNLVLGYMVKVYDKNSWYAKWYYWVFAFLCLIFPIFIMFSIFEIQIFIETASKLNVPGKEIYTSPYSWILCLIVPVVGWVMLIVMLIYVVIWPSIMIKRKEGEKCVA